MKGKYLRMMREAELGPYPQVGSLIRQGRGVARKYSLLIFTVAFALAALAGLGVAVANPSVTVLAAQSVQGIYELSFFADTLEGLVPLTNNSLPILTELVLKAHVEDTSGHPAKRGSVIFQDCLLNGDPVPSTACDSGSGAWSHIITLPVDQNGNVGGLWICLASQNHRLPVSVYGTGKRYPQWRERARKCHLVLTQQTLPVSMLGFRKCAERTSLSQVTARWLENGLVSALVGSATATRGTSCVLKLWSLSCGIDFVSAAQLADRRSHAHVRYN